MPAFINHSKLKHDREIAREAKRLAKLAHREARQQERIDSHQGQVRHEGSPYDTERTDDV